MMILRSVSNSEGESGVRRDAADKAEYSCKGAEVLKTVSLPMIDKLVLQQLAADPHVHTTEIDMSQKVPENLQRL